MNKLNILLMGVGVQQIPAIEKCKELGIGVYGFDGNPDAAGKPLLDGFECVDIKNPNEVERVALKLNKKVGIDGCLAPATEMGISVGRVVDKLNLRGIGEETAEMLTDKCLRNSWLLENNILFPNTFGSIEQFPVVIKPKNQSAAVGVKLIETAEQLKNEKYDIIQEYLEGWELSTEVLVLDNGMFMVANADRNYDKKLKWKPYLLEDGCQIPSKIPPRIARKVLELVSKIVKILQLRSCAIKLDLLIKDNLVYVIEVAPRLGGGRLSSDMIPLAYGIDWWKIAIKLAMGLPLEEDLLPKHTKFVAQRYVFPENPKSHRDRLKDFIETGETYEEAIKNAQRKVDEFILPTTR
jgi:biotin carboxylase